MNYESEARSHQNRSIASKSDGLPNASIFGLSSFHEACYNSMIHEKLNRSHLNHMSYKIRSITFLNPVLASAALV